MLEITTILHPTDFSKSARYAFHLACSLAKDHGARLIVMHVPPAPRVSLYDGVPVVEQLAESEAETKARLHSLKPSDSTVGIDYRIEKGVPAEEILRVAKESGCDLIVMGTHGRSGLSRLVMGSVAEQVLRRADCPVLTVKNSSSQEAREQTGRQKAAIVSA